ncbi:MAG: LCP family protein [Tumebacillaceae bacterium]
MAYQAKQITYGQKQPEPPRRKVRWGRILLALLLFALVLGVTTLAAYGWYLERKVVVEPNGAPAPLAKDKPVNVLVIGVDRDPKSGEPTRRQTLNTDTLIVAHIDPAGSTASLLSIPRDTRVQLPTGIEKINAAYAIGGMDRLKRTVTDLTGLNIDRYVMIDFPAFAGLVDALGGVTFNVDKPIQNPEGTVSLQPGEQNLNGQGALTVVRDRQEAMGDIARVQRQQKFLDAVGAKLRQSNVVDWMKALRAMSDSLQTDMTINEMGTIAYALHGEGSTITAQTVPGEFLDVYGVSYWKANEAELKKLVQGMTQ